MRATYRSLPALLFLLILGGCYMQQWNGVDGTELGPAPEPVAAFFADLPDQTLILQAHSPGYDYDYDIGEKDSLYGLNDGSLRFSGVEITLLDEMPAGQVLTDLRFLDSAGTILSIDRMDLLKLIPKMDRRDSLVLIEYLLEEFNRFGVQFRKEHAEFRIESTDYAAAPMVMGDYRCKVTNNCLDPTKFELELASEDFTDWDDRFKSDINLNQNRILSHSWFFLDSRLYDILYEYKNPDIPFELGSDFTRIGKIAETIRIDFEQLRHPIKERSKTRMIEVGHWTDRPIEPLDIEQFYKEEFDLLLNEGSFTYSTILDTIITTTQFREEGYYNDTITRSFDWSWMRGLDDIQIDMIDHPGTETYAQITLGGEHAYYTLTIGNIDLALISEQALWGLNFGINTYPKTRRYNPAQPTIRYDAEQLPEDLMPYVLLTETSTGKWVNNIDRGVEKIYLTYESIEKDILNVYVLSYERITPVWMGSVKLPTTLRERIRVKQSLYNY